MVDPRALLEVFATCFKDIDGFESHHSVNKGNVRIAADAWRRFAALWTENRAAARAWCDEYFAANRRAIFARYMTDNASAVLNDRLEKRHWLPTKLDPAFLYFWPNPVAWNEAVRAVDEALAKLPLDLCDDAEILAEHEGKEHDGCGFMCFVCEDMESAWTKKVLAEVRSNRHNIFLNVDLRKQFCDAGEPPAEWTGPQHISEDNRNHETLDGKTPSQAFSSFMSKTWHERWSLKLPRGTISDYDVFLIFWQHGDYVDGQLDVNAKRVDEIVALL